MVQRCLFGFGEAGDQWGATRFDQHITQACAYQVCIAAMATGQHQRQIGALRDEFAQLGVYAAQQGEVVLRDFRYRALT